jgi:hypothetical protein
LISNVTGMLPLHCITIRLKVRAKAKARVRAKPKARARVGLKINKIDCQLMFVIVLDAKMTYC